MLNNCLIKEFEVKVQRLDNFMEIKNMMRILLEMKPGKENKPKFSGQGKVLT